MEIIDCPYEKKFKELLQRLEEENEFQHWDSQPGRYALRKAIKWTKEKLEEANRQSHFWRA